MSNDVVELIKLHIAKFPVKETHYGTKIIKYLDARLTIKKMFQLFTEEHPNVPVKYEYYYTYFVEHYSLRFGRPQVDVCGACEHLATRLKNAKGNADEEASISVEKEAHRVRYRKFYNQMTEIQRRSKTEPRVLGLCFDFMKNLPLPEIPVQETFYLRQLWLNVFCVFNMKTGKSHIFVYSEGIAKKGGKDVCSMLLHYIQTELGKDFGGVKELYLFCDGTVAQNKNHCMLRFGCALAEKYFEVVHSYFPERGHSFLRCDTTFGQIKRQLTNCDRYYSPWGYIKRISRVANVEVIYMEDSEFIYDFDRWWPQYYVKEPKSLETAHLPAPSRVKLQPMSYKHFAYTENGSFIRAYATIDDVTSMQTFRVRKSTNFNLEFPTERGYNGYHGILATKKTDIAGLMKYIPKTNRRTRKFWYTVMQKYPVYTRQTSE